MQRRGFGAQQRVNYARGEREGGGWGGVKHLACAVQRVMGGGGGSIVVAGVIRHISCGGSCEGVPK